MADTLGRVIRRVAAGSASTSNRFAALEALDALSAQVWLTSDINHLGDESTYRTLASIPGFVDLQRPPPVGGIPSVPSQFDWIGPFDDTPAPAVACFGAHPIYRVARDAATWPKIVLRGRVQPPVSGTGAINVCFLVVPGFESNPAGVTSPSMYAITTIAGNGGVWVDLKIDIQISPDLVSSVTRSPILGAPSSGVPALGELLNVTVLTPYVSFNSAGSGKCSGVALTVALEPP